MAEAKFDFIRYSNCWEDTENLLHSLDMKGKKGVSILSAGDNTLALLLADPEKITAFDLNPTQIHLFYLKKAGFQTLSHEQLLELLGVNGTAKSRERFLSLKGIMDPEAFAYFESHPEFFEEGIVNMGKFEHYFQIFRNKVVPLFTTKKHMDTLALFKDPDEQKAYYDRYVNNRRMKGIFQVFFGFRMMGKLGRDKHFYDHVEDKEDSASNIKAVADTGMGRIPNWDNPYMTYVLTNRYPDHALPYYLRPEHHDTIRDRLDRIEVVQGSFTDITGSYDFFNLSDIFEYMSGDVFQKNVEHLKETANPGGRVAYYNMQGKRYLPEGDFHYKKELSEYRTKKTKSYFYRDFNVYDIGEGQ